VGAVVGAVALVVIIGLVVTRTSGSGDSSNALTGAGPVSANLIRGGDLGDVDGDQALRQKIEPTLKTGASHTSQKPGPQPACAGEARKLQRSGPVLTYVATARWQGTAADVFGFSPPGAPATSSRGRPSPTRLYVLARSDCRLLVFQSYAP
jgi:hypothetical protein